MTLTELLPMVQQLSAANKLKLNSADLRALK